MRTFRHVLPLLMIIVVDLASSRQLIFQQPLSPRIANYTISVTLDAEKKMLNGKETLRWRNTSSDRISELEFHLYLNAFKNSESTFMKESGGQNRGIPMESDGWGWIDVTAVRVRDGEELRSRMEFIHPDDDNTADRTVFRVPLSKPVFPNQTITIDIDFTAKLPKVFARTGFQDDFFMVGQWFPKIGVYEPAGMRYATRGQWNCHQFHSNSEFYADYGVYDVDMTVPRDFVLGATGILEHDRENNNGTKTYFYHAEDVHDFSWTASPLYRAVEDQWNNVKIRLLVQPQRMNGIAQRYLQSVKAALAFFHDHVGAYPYPNLTLVDPQWGAEGAGGMEYPTLITLGAWWGIPGGYKDAEGVTIHEFGHQYFYGLVGSNEFEEAWLDEGITEYYETRIMDATYGAKTSFVDLFGFHAGDFEFWRSGYTGLKNPKIAPTYAKAWDYNVGGYAGMTYSKSAVFLRTLEGLVGADVMDEVMKTYFERWKFRHPCSKDFIAVVNEVVRKRLGDKLGRNMDWFFDQVLYGTDVCDYKLARITNIPTSAPRQNADTSRSATSGGTNNEHVRSRQYQCTVLVTRLGEVKLPVDILVHFQNGKEVRERWDGQDRWKEFSYSGTDRIAWATVDPDNKLPIDVDVNNNGQMADAPSQPIWKYTVKFLYWMQNILQYSSLF